jgi:hypothetical protein
VPKTRRSKKSPVKFRLLVQVAAADDPITDATKVWPDSRPTVDLGEIAVIKALDTKKVENELLFLPTNLTSGIEASSTRAPKPTRNRLAAVANRSPYNRRIDVCPRQFSPCMIVADPVIQHQERPPAGLDRWSANQEKPIWILAVIRGKRTMC